MTTERDAALRRAGQAETELTRLRAEIDSVIIAGTILHNAAEQAGVDWACEQWRYTLAQFKAFPK